MEKILITGGLGHIGSQLIHDLQDVEAIDHVTVVDDLSAESSAPPEHFSDLDLHIRPFQSLTEDDLEKFTTVVHLAAITDAAGSFEREDEIKKVNIDDTLSFFQKCRVAKVAHLIWPSSTSVYGKGQKVMYEHEDNILPQSPYAESKVRVEDTLIKYNTTKLPSETKSTILRFGTIFGLTKGIRFHTAINKFCNQVNSCDCLTVWKENYHHKRPYLGVKDASRAIQMSIDGHLDSGIYNVVTKNYELAEIIDIIKSKTDKDVDVEFIDTPLLNQHTYEVACDKIISSGWAPLDDLGDAIKETLEYLEKC